MSKVRDVASMARKGRMAFRTDEKSEVLRKLQGRIYFEKSLSASSASDHGYSALALPSWFVQEHGDKFRQSVILRSESSAKSWNVKLTIQYESPACNRQVKFSAGWKGFATSSGLLAGDSLIFLLTAMSEFMVHIFRGTRNPRRCRSELAPREWSDASEPSQKRAKLAYENKDEQWADAEGGSEGTVQSNGVFSKKKTIGEECTASGSYQSSQFYTRPLLEFPSFLKKLTVSNIGPGGVMEIPLDFWKTYSSRFHSHVELQGIHEESQVRSVACVTTHGNPMRHFLRAEWRDFANENKLVVGQELLFALTADSFFVVREVLPPSREVYSPR